MTRRSTAPYGPLAKSATDIATQAPLVMATRMFNLMMAGPNPTLKDQREATRMVLEKQAAFMESSAVIVNAYQRSVMDFWSGIAFGGWPKLPSHASTVRTATQALRPYRKRVASNSKRLHPRRR